MRKILYPTILLVLALALLGLMGCVGEGEDIVSETGTVKYIDLEGGFYGIISDNGEHYDPINLGQEFQEDALRVLITAKILEDVATTRMWGRPIEIIKIERLESG